MPPENENNQRRTLYSDIGDIGDFAVEDVGGFLREDVGGGITSAAQATKDFAGRTVRESTAQVGRAGAGVQSYLTPQSMAAPVTGTYEGGAPDTDREFSSVGTDNQESATTTPDQQTGTTNQPTNATQDTQQDDSQPLTGRDINQMASPAGRIFPEMSNPADLRVSEPNVQQQEDAGTISQESGTQTAPQAQREDDYSQTLQRIEQEARNIQAQLQNRSAVDFSPQSRPVVETEEQRRMVEQADDPDTLRQRMDDAREQFNLPELEKQREQIATQVQAEREAFNRAIEEVDDQEQIFGAMERRRLNNLEQQRDQRIQSLTNLQDTITQQIDAINTRVNQEVQAEQVRDQREQEQQQESMQRVGNLIETGALAQMSDQELTSVAQESGYTPQTLARIRQSQRQSLQQVDASGTVGEFQDLKRLGALGEDVSYQQFLQMRNQEGDSGAAFQQEFIAAQKFANQRVGQMDRQQLINQINLQTNNLNSGEIEDIVTQAEQSSGTELQKRRFTQQVMDNIEWHKQTGVTDPEETAERVITSYAQSKGLDSADDVPENIRNIITGLTKRSYGKEQQQ